MLASLQSRLAGGGAKGELILLLRSGGHLGAEPSFLQEPQSFLSRASTDWMRTTHIVNGDLLYSQSADVHADHILKMPPQ